VDDLCMVVGKVCGRHVGTKVAEASSIHLCRVLDRSA
jgi:hypothetical protein